MLIDFPDGNAVVEHLIGCVGEPFGFVHLDQVLHVADFEVGGAVVEQVELIDGAGLASELEPVRFRLLEALLDFVVAAFEFAGQVGVVADYLLAFDDRVSHFSAFHVEWLLFLAAPTHP